MRNLYNEIGDTSVIFLHAREYLSYSLAMEKCWSNARILHCTTMEKSVIFKPFNYVVWFIIAIASFSTELVLLFMRPVVSKLPLLLVSMHCVSLVVLPPAFDALLCDHHPQPCLFWELGMWPTIVIADCYLSSFITCRCWFLFCILWLVLCYSCCSLLSQCAILAAHHHDTCHSMHLVLLEYNKSARFSEIYTRLDNNHDNGLKNGQINEIHRLTKH